MSARTVLIVLLLASPSSAESFKSWAARGAREERERNPNAALESYSNALSAWKDSDGKSAKARVLCARAALRDKLGQEDGALGDYTDCLALDKKNARAFHRRGQLRFKAGKTSAAIDDYYKATSLDINYREAYADRALAYEKQGDLEFAAEDYRHACELGEKAACPSAKRLAPARKRGKRGRKAAPEPADKDGAAQVEDVPADASADASAAEAPAPAAEAPAEKTDAAPAPEQTLEAPPAKSKKKRKPAAPAYHPRFEDCLSTLQSCVDGGAAFGDCVAKAPACEQKAVMGCCPNTCLQAYRKALNGGSSEASAFRDVFAPESNCAAAPKPDDD